jgi:hypothetical protein
MYLIRKTKTTETFVTERIRNLIGSLSSTELRKEKI